MTKEEFKRYRDIDRELRQLERQMDKLRTQAENPVTARWTYTRGGTNVSDIMAEAVVKMVDLERRHAKMWDELIAEHQKIEDAIESLSDPAHRRLMRYYYIEGLKWEAVCLEMHVSWPTVHRMHAQALMAAQKNAAS